MYPVSSGYLSAVRAKVRTDRLLGSITLSDGTVIAINDSVLVKDTVKLTRELCRGSYRIGTFSLACLQFSVFIDDALGIDLTDAYAELEYGLSVNGVYEDIPLGRFLIDPVLSIRRKDILSVVAYDEGVLFDVKPSDTLKNMSAVPAALIAAACAECGVSTDIMAQTSLPFPNASLTVCAQSSQIQTCRDLIMWCAALMCCYAAIDRDSKLVLIPAKYAVDPNDSTVIITDRTIRADERESIIVTDTRAYIKYLTAYSENDVVSYTSSYVSQDEQASPAAYVLEKNPLLEGVSAADCNTVNTAWLAYIDSFKQRGVRAVIFGDPAIDPGDTIIFRGGDVDQRSGIIGVVTGIEWRYRGADTIECLAAECVGRLTGQSSSIVSSNVRKQSSKRIDNTSGGSGSGGAGEEIGNHSVRFNEDTNTVTESQFYGYNILGGRDNSLTNSIKTIIDGAQNSGASVTECIISGEQNTVSQANKSIISGLRNNVTDDDEGIVTGQNNTTNGNSDTVTTGFENTVSYCQDCNISGKNNTARYATNSIVTGYNNTAASSRDSITAGSGNTADQDRAVTAGLGNKAVSDGLTVGRYSQYNSNNRIVIGNGNDDNNRSNAFYVMYDGTTYAKVYNTTGADYAEFFEWADGNPKNEDRRGLLVKLVGDRIAAAHGDEILGAVSARPSVIGNACEEHWHGKYKLDVFGDYVLDENGERQLSDDYDPERKYIPRSQRQEWAPVGMVGRLVIRDNGKCQPGGYVSARQGIGVPTFTETKVRCLKRLDDAHIEVLIR